MRYSNGAISLKIEHTVTVLVVVDRMVRLTRLALTDKNFGELYKIMSSVTCAKPKINGFRTWESVYKSKPISFISNR